MPDSLPLYLEAFRRLKVNRSGGRPSPHKPCMLLAVIGLAEAGHLQRNAIRFNPGLLERYSRLFEVVKSPIDRANPYFPFFHLRSEGFWHLHPMPGREAVVQAMSTARSFADITQNIEFVSLNSDLHMLFCQPYSRAALREELVVKWFGTTRAPMDDLLAEELGSDHYEASLFELMQGNRSAVVAPPPAVRSAAFRRVVGEVYDYRCAASGWRIILPDSRAIVEAAHLIPFAEGHDDDPRNGIALAPSYHWALDNHIIAPGPDLKWHVSEALDDRIADNRPLISLKGRSLILPKDESSWPRSDALEWRLSRLLVS